MMRMKQSAEQIFTKPWVVGLLATFSCFLWGSAFPCVTIGYELFSVDGSIPSLLLYAGLRFALAGVLAIAFGSVGQRRLLYPQKAKNYWYVVALALFQTIGQYIFYYIGLYHTACVKASIINGAGVFLSILIACFLFRQEKFNLVKLLGCLLGLAGVVIVNFDADLELSFAWNGEGFLLISTVLSGVAASLSKIYAKYEHPVTLSGWQFLFGGVVLSAVGLVFGGSVRPTGAGAFFLLIYLALISSVTFSLTGILMKYNPVSVVQSYKSLTPVFGVILSALFLHEEELLSLETLFSLALVVLSIFVINIYGEKKKS